MDVKTAWEHVRALWPDAEWIEKSYDGWEAFLGLQTTRATKALVAAGSSSEIDWGDLTRYPPEPEQWRDAVWPEDWGKKCKATIPGVDDDFVMCILVGMSPKLTPIVLLEDENYYGGKCQVRVTDEEHKWFDGSKQFKKFSTDLKTELQMDLPDEGAIQKLQMKYHALYAAAQRVVEKYYAGGIQLIDAIKELMERLVVKS